MPDVLAVLLQHYFVGDWKSENHYTSAIWVLDDIRIRVCVSESLELIHFY